MPYIPDDKIEDFAQYSPLTLAFTGDAVYELYVRSRLMKKGSLNVNKLHKMATHYVKASAQSESVEAILNSLTEEETAVYKRGRNTKAATVPKNADMADYRRATGFEALLGYLYLGRRQDRLYEIMKMAYDAIEEKVAGNKSMR